MPNVKARPGNGRKSGDETDDKDGARMCGPVKYFRENRQEKTGELESDNCGDKDRTRQLTGRKYLMSYRLPLRFS